MVPHAVPGGEVEVVDLPVGGLAAPATPENQPQRANQKKTKCISNGTGPLLAGQEATSTNQTTEIHNLQKITPGIKCAKPTSLVQMQSKDPARVSSIYMYTNVYIMGRNPCWLGGGKYVTCHVDGYRGSFYMCWDLIHGF